MLIGCTLHDQMVEGSNPGKTSVSPLNKVPLFPVSSLRPGEKQLGRDRQSAGIER